MEQFEFATSSVKQLLQHVPSNKQILQVGANGEFS